MEIKNKTKNFTRDSRSEELQYFLEGVNGIDSISRSQLIEFYQLVLQENSAQNLTRLLSPEDFFWGHFWDTIELNRLQWIRFPALDLGSGVGVPGIPLAILEKGKWVLAESEKKKADYLQKAVNILGLTTQIRVFAGRAEDYLQNERVESIVTRAVGPVDRIYSWIRGCSTWNKLILFKGPGWPQEWERFLEGRWKKELRIEKEHDYFLEPVQKKRKLILLSRVPRGTIQVQA